MKKKILIVNNNMHIGGVQKSLVNLLWNISDEYDVTLLLFYKGGKLLKDLPEKVKVIEANFAYRFLGMSRLDCKNIPEKIGRTFFAAISRIIGRKYAIMLMGLFQKKIKGFDVAVSYLHNPSDKMFYGGCNDFVLKHVAAQKKIAFLHCDYNLCGANTLENAKLYKKFDVIAACSRGCADSFVKACPSLKDKVKVVYNCHRFDQIKAMAKEDPISMEEDKVNIVTVARLGKEKGVERAVRAVASLGNLKENIKYYIIGDGIQKKLIKEIIEKENLSRNIVLCGEKTNPYGYISAADMLLIPSYSEAAPLVIGEAACLGTPILSTKTSSAMEMIVNRGFGWVCENSEEAIVEKLKEILNNTSCIYEKKEEIRKKNPDNDFALEQFYSCIK